MWHDAQGVGVGEMCVPVNVNPVMLWSKDAASHPAVVWQVEQFAAANAAPDAECTGLFVPCHVVKWHCEFPQSVGAIVKA
jgi:hypothetical protein